MTSEIYVHTYTQIHKLLFISLPSKTHCSLHPYSHEVILMLDFYDSSIYFPQTFQIFKDCQQHLAISLYSVHITIELWSSIQKMSKGRTHAFFSSWFNFFLLFPFYLFFGYSFFVKSLYDIPCLQP